MLALVARRLDEQSELLAEIRDRLPAPTELRFEVRGQSGPVEVREPAPAGKPAGEGNAGSQGESGAEPVHVTEPAPPPRPAKKTAAKKASKPAKK